MKKIIFGLALFYLTFQSIFAQQACITDNFSVPALWTHAGTNGNVKINNNSIFFDNAQDGSEDRVWRQVNALNTWSIDFDFFPTAQQNASHSILDFTSNNLDPWYTGVFGTITNQDECGISYSSNGNVPVINLKAKQGLVNVPNPNAGIPLPVGTIYSIRFERLNGQTLRLSVFTNSLRTTLIGSPIVLTIPCNLSSLGFLQSCVGWGGSSDRSLTARLSNFSICPLINNGQSACAIQNCLLDDNSLVASWAHRGTLTNVSAQGNSVRFNASVDGKQDRVSRPVNSYNTWRATFDFTPTANNDAAHFIFCYSQFDLDPWFTPIWGTITNQDHCALTYNSNANVPTLSMNAKQGLVNAPNNNVGIPLPLGQTYFITFERIDGVTLRLSVFNDAARTVRVGATQLLTIPCTLGNLNFIQSGAGWGGSPARSLSATINNISLCPIIEDPTLTFKAIPESYRVCSGSSNSASIRLTSNRTNTNYSWTVSTITGIVNGAANGSGNTTANLISQKLTGDGKVRYHITATSIIGCQLVEQIIDVDITVVPLPIVTVNSGTVCGNGSAATLKATSSLPNTQFFWTPSTGLNTTTGAQVIAKPAVTTHYTIIATSDICAGFGYADVTRLTAPDIAISPVSPIQVPCTQTIFDLTASSSVPGLTYTWSTDSWNGNYLNSTTGAHVTATVPYSTTDINYTVSGSINNCISNATVTINRNCALPLHFTAVSLSVTGPRQVTVSWTAVNESNMLRYEIQRSMDGGFTFQTLPNSTVTPIGGTASHSYTWIDNNAPAGGPFYRITRIDNAGNAEYSSFRSIGVKRIAEGTDDLSSFETLSEVLISPNPSSGAFNLHGNLSGTGEITVTDALGQTVEKSAFHDLSGSLQFGEQLKKGIYVVTIASDSGGIQHLTVIKE